MLEDTVEVAAAMKGQKSNCIISCKKANPVFGFAFFVVFTLNMFKGILQFWATKNDFGYAIIKEG